MGGGCITVQVELLIPKQVNHKSWDRHPLLQEYSQLM